MTLTLFSSKRFPNCRSGWRSGDFPSPFLTITYQLPLFETWPRQWGRTFYGGLLEEPPHKVGQHCKQQQHEHPANPDEEVQREARRVL